MRLLKDHPGQGPAHLQSLGDQSWSWEHPYRDFPWTNDSDWVIHPVQSSDLGPLLFGPLICPFLESFFFLSSLGCVTKLEPEGPWNLSRMWNKKKHVSLISSESLPPSPANIFGYSLCPKHCANPMALWLGRCADHQWMPTSCFLLRLWGAEYSSIPGPREPACLRP